MGFSKKIGDTTMDKPKNVAPDDRKAILVLNIGNLRQENIEEVIVHELMHLKFYPLDQITEGLIGGH